MFGKKESSITPFAGQILMTERMLLTPYQYIDCEEWITARQETRSLLMPWEPTWSKDVLTDRAFKTRVDFFTEGAKQDLYYCFLNRLKDSNRLIGGIGLNRVNRGVEQTGVIGYWCRRDDMRNGYTIEAINRILEFSFEDLKLNRVQASCMPENIAGLKTLEKAGFQKEGLARQYLKIQGEWTDHFIFSRLASDG